MGEKNSKTKKNGRNKGKIPHLVALPSSTKSGGQLISGVRKHRKQAGPTLGGTGVLV